MRTLKDLKLTKQTEAKVKAWLDEWLEHFIEAAQGETANVYRADFDKMDFFYFTNCNDVLSKDPESLGDESNLTIRKRKRTIMLQLFVRTLLGEELGTKLKCSHCGYPEMHIDGTDNGGGHFTYCPKCHYTAFNTYPEFYAEFIKYMKMKLIEKGIVE